MARSTIQWTDYTWNPWQGCRKVSQGCKFCYMFRDKHRYGQDPTAVVRSSPATFNAPIKNGAKRWPDGSRVFTCSWSDFFIEEADAWRADAWAIIRQRPGITFQILTKRPERIHACLPPDWGPNGYPNVWIGVSVEDQRQYEIRHPLLARIPAAVRFLSMEPLLGPVDLALAGTAPRDWHGTDHQTPVSDFIDWVIVGGESGNNSDDSRPCLAEWIRDVVKECVMADVPVFVKQLGSQFIDEKHGVAGALLPLQSDVQVKPRAPWQTTPMVTIRRLHDRHGGEPDEWPPGLLVRQFPGEVGR